MYTKKIAVIGGGISGITCALTMQLLGFPTTCYARELVPVSGSGADAGEDPRFASLYPAASVIPHSIQADNRLQSLFMATQKIFSRLLDGEFPGVTLHHHYEVFEFPKELPAYVTLMQNPEPVRPEDPNLPRHPEAERLYGWSFDCFIAEWPRYIGALYALFESSGGRLLQQEVRPEDLRKMDEQTIINCTGIWSPLLFGTPESDPEEGREVICGHLVSLPGAPLHRDDNGRILSYNYTPGPDRYASPEGEACDVYFYPRSNGWIMGGSRVKGRLTPDGHWEGALPEDTVPVTGVDLPRPILELNREILSHSWGLDPDLHTDGRTARMGYRYMGHPRLGGLCLSSERAFGRKVIHNYGHGGAGVTLSWGCALAAAIMTRRNAGDSRAGTSGLNEVALQLMDALSGVRIGGSGS